MGGTMDKLTYLLGAGASCNALPMVNNLAERVSKFSEMLKAHVMYGDKSTDPFVYQKPDPTWPDNSLRKQFIESLDWLGNLAKKHASIDTYAKKLYVRGGEEATKDLHRLKSTLSCYLLLEQSLNPVGKRYDLFFASILVGKYPDFPSLPKTVNIVTWNFDTQMEKSYIDFCPDPEVMDEKITRAPNIIRLNGVCGQPHKHKELCYADFNDSLIKSVLELFQNHMNREVVGYSPSISFAWEKSKLEDRIIEVVKETTILVLIGYSLPFFNSDIDTALFKIMAPTLKKIFIQVPESAHAAVRERFLTLCEDESVRRVTRDKIEMLCGTDQFYIPSKPEFGIM
jgi:hypothetical protein